MWVHARRLGGGGLAGSGPGRISANIPGPVPDPMQNPTPPFKIDHFALLGKGMSMYVAKSDKEREWDFA